ncbi:GntR family transcriptional regulator [soil metagenome]
MTSTTGSAPSRRQLPDQIRDIILNRIHDGTLAVGAQLPPEPDLCDEFAVSRATIREAVRALVESGYLTRVQGSGTYVAFQPRLRHTLERNLSYTKLISQAGLVPSRRVLGLERMAIDDEEAKALGTGIGVDGVRIERVRSADSRPVIYSIDVIPSHFVRDVPDETFAGSLYELFRSIGHTVAHGDATLAPVVADPTLAEILEVDRNSPLLMIRQVDHTAAGEAVMYSREWHVPGVFELSLLRRAT